LVPNDFSSARYSSTTVNGDRAVRRSQSFSKQLIESLCLFINPNCQALAYNSIGYFVL
jgi:hypothetical protein